MGVDLTMLPFDGSESVPFSHSVLSLGRGRRRGLFEAIAEVETKIGKDLPEGFTSYLGTGKDGEPCYGKITKTPYGGPVRSVPAGALKALRSHEDVTESPKNRPVWAYLEQLDDEKPVALYWH